MYITNQRFYNSDGNYAHEPYFSHVSKGAFFHSKAALHCELHNWEKARDEIIETNLFEFFYTRRMTVLSRVDGFMLYGKRAAHIFHFSTASSWYES